MTGVDADIIIELADRETMAVVRLILRRSLPPLPLEQAALYYGAITEIMTNALDAHDRVGSERPIVVSARFDDAPQVVVSDEGGGFEVGHVHAGGDPESGRGLSIARAVCPDLTIDSTERGTIVTLPYPGDDRDA